MLLNQKYEIFPTEEQKERLDRWLQYCRQIYNSALLDKERKYKENKQNYSRYDMQKQLKLDKKKYPFLKEVPSQPLQEVFLRLKKAFENFFRKNAKYPKPKKYKDYTSMTFPQFGFNHKGNRMAMSFSDNGKLYNTKLGEIEILFHRPIEGTIKQLIIKRQGNEFYLKLKKLYSNDEWPTVLQNILQKLESLPNLPDSYVEILKTENLSEKLLTYCQQNPPAIESLYTYLIKDYSNEVDEIFKVNIRMASNLANDRNKYKKVCSIIKTYKKGCGLSSALPLIQELKERYIRRPAFVDELEKLERKLK